MSCSSLHGTDMFIITGTAKPSEFVGASAGDEVLVEVLELTQGNRKVSCNRKFPVVDPAVEFSWSMVVSASHFVTGLADRSKVRATLRPNGSGGGGAPETWVQPDSAIRAPSDPDHQELDGAGRGRPRLRLGLGPRLAGREAGSGSSSTGAGAARAGARRASSRPP